MISFILLDLAIMFANCGAWKIIQSGNPKDSLRGDLIFVDLIYLLIPGVNIILLISFLMIIFLESKIK